MNRLINHSNLTPRMILAGARAGPAAGAGDREEVGAGGDVRAPLLHRADAAGEAD